MTAPASIDQKLKLSLRFGMGGLTAARWVALGMIGLAIVAGAAARWQAVGGDRRVSADEQGYVANANRILAGRRYATFKWPPATSLAFALATRLSGSHRLSARPHARGPAQDAQLAMGVALLALVAVLAWALAGPWAAVAATAAVASYEPLILATRSFLSEPAGALALVAAVAAAAWARARLGRRRELGALALAGAVGGLACLARGDLAFGMGALAIALALAGRPGWRVGAVRAGVYLTGVLAALAPWLAYASASEGRFVPVTTAGPDAFFVGTYLPGKGLLVPTEEKLAPAVCRRFRSDCGPYWQRSSAPLFALLRARHPHASANGAVMDADLENVRGYMLGRPLAFAGMLWGKFRAMWTTAWSGGNSAFHPETSKAQHLVYLALAWLGLVAGIALTRRRTVPGPGAGDCARTTTAAWTVTASAAVLLTVAALATMFNDQPRYNVSLMPLLLVSGTVGLWLAGARLIELARARAAGPGRT
jgi:hypothetical protein